MINALLNAFFRRRTGRFKKFESIPFEIQQDQLLKLLRMAAHTEFGKTYNFAKIHSVEEYRKQVPLFYYEDYKSYIDRVRQGEQNVIWPTPIRWLAKSSGTTDGKSKYIPVTTEGLQQCHYQGGMDALAVYASWYPDNQLFTGKCLTLGGSHQIDKLNEHVHTGDLSAILIQHLPFYIHWLRTPSLQTALLSNWEEKLEKITKEVIRQKVTSFAGVPSWNLVLMKHILEYTGKKNMLEVWPSVELFIHGGISFKPYRDQYYKLFPSSSIHYLETYNASEGFFSVQDNPHDESMLLMLDYGIFYEFIPVDRLKEDPPPVCHIGEVKPHTDYAMVISSCNGLWRYIVGDTVKFTSVYPHKIVITGRTKHFINAFGEELIVENAEKALAEACKATGALVNEYTVAPVYFGDHRKGTHEWIVEFEKQPNDIQLFIDVLDKTLMELNSDYEAKRYKSITMDKPVVRVVKKGTFYQWCRQKNKLGGQNKIPRLFNERTYAEEILKLNY